MNNFALNNHIIFEIKNINQFFISNIIIKAVLQLQL